MRYKHLLSEQQLDELRMSPRSLQQFASGPEAAGIRAGFEAELVFTGLGGEGEYDEDPEPDYDADERCRSLDQVVEFFENDEYGYGLSSREADRLRESLDEQYYDWHDEEMRRQFQDEQEDLIRKVLVDEGDWDEDNEIQKQLELLDLPVDEFNAIIQAGERAPKFTSSKDQRSYAQTNPLYDQYLDAQEEAEGLLDELVQDSIRAQDKFYDSALDDFRENFYMDDDSEFFSDVGLRYMSDVANEYSLMWPVMTYTGSSSEGGWSEDNARELASSLSDTLDVKTKVSGGYHNASRDDETWIFEPDSSLDSDDSDNMSVEIISPPMPLEECLAKMEQFFEWAEDNGAYSNSSTGFHMGVSLPHRGGAVDYVKLALFLGDEHVLQEFGRSGNHFCEAALKKIRGRVKNNKEAVGNAMELMRSNLLELAQKALEINNNGFGKYTSINPKGGSDSRDPSQSRGAKYIEFRSAGNSNYFEDIDKLKNTLMRYAQAMAIAGNPSAERKEYYKKLYKLISPPEGDPALDLFSRFATGEISSADLKKQWADKQLEKEPKGNWKLWNANNGVAVPGQEYNGYTQTDAWERARQKLLPDASMSQFRLAYTLRPMQSETGEWEVYDTKTGETLETLRGYATRGAAADAVYDKYAEQGIAFNLRPADPEAPEKPLTKRERLAKNIKSAPAEEIKNWKIYDTKTGEVHYEQEGRKSSLVQTMRKFERDHKLPQGRLAIEEIPGLDAEMDVAQNFDNPATVKRKWEFYRAETGNVIDTVDDINQMQAEAVRKDLVRRYGHPDDSVRKRSVPTDASAERARAGSETPWRDDLENHVHQAQQTSDAPPAGMLAQRPGTGDYYEVRGDNDRVYGYLPTGATSSDVARDARLYVNQLTGGDRAYVQYRAGDPVQARASNGVPAWEIYERETGHVINTIFDHDQTSAWQQAQRYLRDINAEQPELFSCRPKMET